MLAFQRDNSFLFRLVEALGLDPKNRPITRVVIDAKVDDVVRVYIHELLDDKPGQPTVPELLAESVNTVEVTAIELTHALTIDDFGRVKYEPRKGK